MVFLHNGGTSHRTWEPLIERYAVDHDVIAPDMLGFGRSGHPRIDYSLDLYVEMLGALLGELDLGEVTLVGNRMGAATVLRPSQPHEGTLNPPYTGAGFALIQLANPLREYAGRCYLASDATWLREAGRLLLSSILPAHSSVGEAQRFGDDRRSFFEQGGGAGCLRAVHLIRGRLAPGSLAHKPCHRATSGYDEIRHFLKADEATIDEAPDLQNREQRASAGDIDNHDVCAPRIDSMSAVREGDDRSRERYVFDRGWAASLWLGERHCCTAP